MGQACLQQKSGVSNLPATPPEGAFMEDKPQGDDSTMEEDSMMKDDKSPSDDSMMKQEDKMEGDATKKDDAMMEDAPKEDSTMKQEDKMMQNEEDSMMKDSEQSSAVPYYIAFSNGEFNRAASARKATLMYFYAPWCPICQAEEPKVKSWVEGSGLNVAGFRVDYDHETQLKQKLGVTSQHTTIIFDTQGKESARYVGPVDQATLLDALKQASQA